MVHVDEERQNENKNRNKSDTGRDPLIYLHPTLIGVPASVQPPRITLHTAGKDLVLISPDSPPDWRESHIYDAI